MNMMKKIGLGAVLAANTLGAVVPTAAEARGWGRGGYGGYRGGYRGGDRTGAAIAGGIIGLALGAAIAESSRDRYYYDGPRYRRRGYYNDYRSCGWQTRWDYYGRPYSVRVCY